MSALADSTTATAKGRILVAYATKHGSTIEVADAIATALRDGEHEVDVAPAAAPIRGDAPASRQSWSVAGRSSLRARRAASRRPSEE
jgi:hypothetical protein